MKKCSRRKSGGLLTISFVLMLSNWGCSRSGELERIEGTAEAEEVRGFWQSGDAESEWVAQFSGDQLTSISEEMSSGDYGNARFQMNYSGGLLRSYSEEGIRVSLDVATGEARSQAVRLQVEFDDQGRFLRGEKTVDGVAVDLEEYELDQTDHAEALAGAAVRQRTLGDPLFRCLGNEPFWNLEITGQEAVLNQLEEEPKDLRGRFFWSGEDGLEWWGEQKTGAGLLSASISAGPCRDTMSDEGGSFSHSIRLFLPQGLDVSGCCRSAEPGG